MPTPRPRLSPVVTRTPLRPRMPSPSPAPLEPVTPPMVVTREPVSRAPAPLSPSAPIPARDVPTSITPGVPSITGPDVRLSLPPAGLFADALVQWVVPELQRHNDIRDRTAWYTGTLIAALVPAGSDLAAGNMKELVSKHRLPISHMTAQKYVTVARSFREDVVVREGVEKCYSLAVYSKLLVKLGLPAKEARYVLSENAVIEGSAGPDGAPLRARTITNAALRLAIRALKLRLRAPEPVETPRARAQNEQALAAVKEHARKSGIVGSQMRLLRRRGRTVVAIYVPVDRALALDERRPAATLRLVKELTRTDEDFVHDLERAGWARRGRARATG